METGPTIRLRAAPIAAAQRVLCRGRPGSGMGGWVGPGPGIARSRGARMPRVEFAGGTRWALAHLRGVLVALVIAVAPLGAAVCTAASRIDDWPRDPAGAVASWCAGPP